MGCSISSLLKSSVPEQQPHLSSLPCDKAFRRLTIHCNVRFFVLPEACLASIAHTRLLGVELQYRLLIPYSNRCRLHCKAWQHRMTMRCGISHHACCNMCPASNCQYAWCQALNQMYTTNSSCPTDGLVHQQYDSNVSLVQD